MTDDERWCIREILIDAGAPDGDVEWLTASCPSIDHARGYRPPCTPVHRELAKVDVSGSWCCVRCGGRSGGLPFCTRCAEERRRDRARAIYRAR